MRIAHIVRQFTPAVGGLENFVSELAAAQRRDGIDAQVITLNRNFTRIDDPLPASEVIGGTPVRRVPYAGSTRYPVAPTVLMQLADFDLIHVHAVDFFCDFLAASAIIHRRPMVLSTHGGFFHTGADARLKRQYFRRVTRSSLHSYSLVFASSKADEALFRSIAPDRTVRIDNGVNTKKFAAASAKCFKPNLLFIGRLSTNKAVGDLLAAFDSAKSEEPDLQLHIVGDDADVTGEQLRVQMRNFASCSAMHLHQRLDDDGLRKLIADCTLFVSASRYEGFGISLVEALSAGLVPVVNRIPIFESILGEAHVGHLADFSCPQSAGAAIVHAVRHHRQQFESQRQAAIAASKPYDWSRVSGEFTRHYERVLGISSRPLLGVDIAVLDEQVATEKITEAIDADAPLKVAFANANTLNIASSDSEYRDTLQQFLVLNDGVGVDLASRMKFGKSFASNLNGTDFVPRLLDHANRPWRVALLGSSQSTMPIAARRFADRWPRHTFLAARDGYFSDSRESQEYCRQLRQQSVDLLLVGMGNPVQEKWIAANGAATGAKVSIGVGALFDFAAGHARRAPRWVRTLRCEWCYRLMQEPRRLASRYLVGNPLFLIRAFRDRLRAGPL